MTQTHPIAPLCISDHGESGTHTDKDFHVGHMISFRYRSFVFGVGPNDLLFAKLIQKCLLFIESMPPNMQYLCLPLFGFGHCILMRFIRHMLSFSRI